MITKDFLRHESVNIHTILGEMIRRENISPSQKKKFLQYIDLLTLFSKYEGIFIGEEFSGFHQSISLSEVLEIAIALCDALGERIEFPKGDFSIRTDRHYLEKGLTNIMRKILRAESPLSVHVCEQEKILLLKHAIENSDFFSEKDLELMLNAKQPDTEEISFQVGVRILRKCGVRIFFGNGEVEMRFE